VATAQRVLELRQKQQELLTECEGIETEIASLNNGQAPVTVSATGKKIGRPKGSTNKKNKVGRPKGSTSKGVKRAHNEHSLAEVIQGVLKGRKNGMQLPDVVKGVHESGYKSNGKGDFAQLVYQTLYKMMKAKNPLVRRDATKAYSLAA
jgi:hypothetical protein